MLGWKTQPTGYQVVTSKYCSVGLSKEDRSYFDLKTKNLMQNPEAIVSRPELNSVTSDVFSFATQKESLVEKSQKILEKFKSFSVEDYEKLSASQISILRKTSLQDGGFGSIQKESFEQILPAYNLMKKNLNTKYPNGFVFVSIGRSPAVFAKMLKMEGHDVIFCPSKSLQGNYSELSKEYINSFSKYLKSIGITREIINKSPKPFVFADYTSTGQSLNNFEKILTEPQIGISKFKKVSFVSINNELLCDRKPSFLKNFSGFKLFNNHFKSNEMKNFIQIFFNEALIKVYSPIPNLGQSKTKNYAKFMKTHEECFESKFMSFQFLDYLKNKKSVLKQLAR